MMRHFNFTPGRGLALVLAGTLGAGGLAAVLYLPGGGNAAHAAPTPPAPPATTAATDTVILSDSQLRGIKTGAVAGREFLMEKSALGSVDYDEDRTVQVFTPYQGRIIRAFFNLGDQVRKGQVLFTLESADFISAQSTLISAAATLDQTQSALQRARELYAAKGIDQNDYETAVANQQIADGNLRAARDAVTIFGRTDAQIDRIVATRRVETALVVKSPISGTVTARNAAPGLFEQPGTVPAPYTVADMSIKWMLANVAEADSPFFKRGQLVHISVSAFPGRTFEGRITALASAVDANSHRVTVRSEIEDPNQELLPQMFATFVIRTGAPLLSAAVPLSGVVREGDGTLSVWQMSDDPHQFIRRSVRVGRQQDGYDEILDGIEAGTTIAVDGAIFLSNILYGGAS